LARAHRRSSRSISSSRPTSGVSADPRYASNRLATLPAPRPTKGIDRLIATYGAERVPQPPKAFHDIPEDKALICVVDTMTYETAIYCFSAVEMALYNVSTRSAAASRSIQPPFLTSLSRWRDGDDPGSPGARAKESFSGCSGFDTNAVRELNGCFSRRSET
jgi:hypothetical protein